MNGWVCADMATTLRRRHWGANGKRVTSRLVFQRYASLKKISERTAEDYFSGRCGPLADVLTMAATAANSDRPDIVEHFHARLREVTQRSRDLTPELISETQQADITEDAIEEAFRVNKCRTTWLPLRRAKLIAIGMEYQLIAAGDDEFRL